VATNLNDREMETFVTQWFMRQDTDWY